MVYDSLCHTHRFHNMISLFVPYLYPVNSTAWHFTCWYLHKSRLCGTCRSHGLHKHTHLQSAWIEKLNTWITSSCLDLAWNEVSIPFTSAPSSFRSLTTNSSWLILSGWSSSSVPMDNGLTNATIPPSTFKSPDFTPLTSGIWAYDGDQILRGISIEKKGKCLESWEYHTTSVNSSMHLSQKKVRLCWPVTSVTTSACFGWNRFAGNQEPTHRPSSSWLTPKSQVHLPQRQLPRPQDMASHMVSFLGTARGHTEKLRLTFNIRGRTIHSCPFTAVMAPASAIQWTGGTKADGVPNLRQQKSWSSRSPLQWFLHTKMI